MVLIGLADLALGSGLAGLALAWLPRLWFFRAWVRRFGFQIWSSCFLVVPLLCFFILRRWDLASSVW